MTRNEEIVRLWEEERLSLRNIGLRVGLSGTMVKKILNSYGIDTSKAGLTSLHKCLNCDVVFKKTRCQRTKKYCSMKCRDEMWKNPNYVPWTHGQRIARKVAGKKFRLWDGTVVHHVDGNQRNNDISNLWVFENQSDHMKWHHYEDLNIVKPIWRGDSKG